jgi:hypothetical protein
MQGRREIVLALVSALQPIVARPLCGPSEWAVEDSNLQPWD